MRVLKAFPWSVRDCSGAITDVQQANVETVKCKRQIDAKFPLRHASSVRNRNVFRALRAAAFDRRDECIRMHSHRQRRNAVAIVRNLPRNQCCGTRMAAAVNMHSRAVYA
jgi:hypothetical protein